MNLYFFEIWQDTKGGRVLVPLLKHTCNLNIPSLMMLSIDQEVVFMVVLVIVPNQ